MSGTKTLKYDDNLTKIISNKYKVMSLQELPLNRKKDIIKEVYSKENTSIRQLSRVLGIEKKTIENVIKGDK